MRQMRVLGAMLVVALAGVSRGGEVLELQPMAEPILSAAEVEQGLRLSGGAQGEKLEKLVFRAWQAEMCLLFLELRSRLNESERATLDQEQELWRSGFGPAIEDGAQSKNPISEYKLGSWMLAERVNVLRKRLKDRAAD